MKTGGRFSNNRYLNLHANLYFNVYAPKLVICRLFCLSVHRQMTTAQNTVQKASNRQLKA